MTDKENKVNEIFEIIHGTLVRSVVPRRGKPYRHSCDIAVFEEVSYTIDELQGGSFVYEDLQIITDQSHSQVATAVAFLKERSCIVSAFRRRHVAATDDCHLDGMLEWHALDASQ